VGDGDGGAGGAIYLGPNNATTAPVANGAVYMFTPTPVAANTYVISSLRHLLSDVISSLASFRL
jgi:hypothetical protein